MKSPPAYTTPEFLPIPDNAFASNEVVQATVGSLRRFIKKIDEVVYPADATDDPTLGINYPITRLRIRGWKLTKPLPVVLETQEDGSYLMSDEVFYEYGEGKTLAEARRDFEKSLIGYYEVLEAHVIDKHPETEAQLKYLQQYLKRW